jgi:hypothetical protein
MPSGMSLYDVVNKDQVPLPTDSEAIAMKIIAADDRLKSRTPKAVQDFDDAMNILRKLYHEDGHITYKDDAEKTAVEDAFNRFYPRYKEAKEAAGEKAGQEFWTEEATRSLPRLALLWKMFAEGPENDRHMYSVMCAE